MFICKRAILVLTLNFWLPLSAQACWSCDPINDRDCAKRIEQNRMETADLLRKRYAAECAEKGKDAFDGLGMGLSTFGSFTISCYEGGGGCMHWTSSDPGLTPRNEYLSLSDGGECHPELQSNKAIASAAKAPAFYQDEHGNRVVFLSEEAALAHQGQSLP